LTFYCRAPFSERPDETLFVVDAQADDAAKTEKQKNVPTKRRKLKEIGPLRCYSILTPSSAVSDPLKKRYLEYSQITILL